MLIEPASNVSEPFTVVIRIAVRVPPKAIEPPVKPTGSVTFPPNTPEAHQLFEEIFVINVFPLYVTAAVVLLKPKPVVKAAPRMAEAPVLAPPPT